MASIFDLKTSVEELSSANQGTSRMEYDQHPPTRDVTNGSFPNGAIHFRFQTSGQKWWVPSRSYIRLRCKLSKTDGIQLVNADDVAPNMGLCANLFQSAEFRINDKTVSRISDFMPQIDALENRLSKSSSWLNGVGASTNFWDSNFQVRQSAVTSDGLLIKELTTSAGNTAVNEARKDSEFELIWTPPLSIFKIGHALPSMKAELVLNPQTNSVYKIAAVQSNAAVKTPGTHYEFSVENMYFYCNTVEGPRADDITYLLDLETTTCNSDKIQTTGFAQRNFDVSPSTYALSVAYQDLRAGNDTLHSSSIFKVFNTANALKDEELKLSRFFINYAGQNLPAPKALGVSMLKALASIECY
jgi:hypothetical protein